MNKLVIKLKTFHAVQSNPEEGFTILELIIVIIIIGILAAISIPIFANQQKAAIIAGMKRDINSTMANIVTYLVHNPAATTAELTGHKTGPSGPQVGAGNYKMVISDPNTTLWVGAGGTNIGNWSDYAVWDKNTSLSSGNTYEVYIYTGSSSVAGKLLTTGHY